MVSLVSRRRTLRRFALGLTALASCALLLAASAQQRFKIRLRPVPIEASIAANTTGAGEATAELSGFTLTLRGRFEGLRGPATIARLHQGPVTGVRGAAFADVRVPAETSGTFDVEIVLTPAQAEALRQRQVYLQIHSESAPDGNLWGWLLP